MLWMMSGTPLHACLPLTMPMWISLRSLFQGESLTVTVGLNGCARDSAAGQE